MHYIVDLAESLVACCMLVYEGLDDLRSVLHVEQSMHNASLSQLLSSDVLAYALQDCTEHCASMVSSQSFHMASLLDWDNAINWA